MISFQKKEHGLIQRYPIVGGRRLSNFWWSTVIFLGGCGFLFTGISSFFNRNLLLTTFPELGTGVTTSKIEHVIDLKKKISINKSINFLQNSSLANQRFASFANQRFARRALHFPPTEDYPSISTSNLVYTNTPSFGLRSSGGDFYISELKQNTLLFPPTCKALLCMDSLIPVNIAGNLNFHFSGVSYKSVTNGLHLRINEKPFHLKDSFSLNFGINNELLRDQAVLKKMSFLNMPNLELTKFKYTTPTRRYQNFMEIATLGVCIGDLGLKILDGLLSTAFLWFATINLSIPILPFFPQGLVLSFYGFLGLWFSFHLWFTLLWKIGAGFNEVNGKEKSIRIFRWGRPGKNRRIDLKYSNELIETIKIELFPKPALFLCIKGNKKIPLTRLGEFIPLEELETQAAELTSLLQVPLEIEEVST